MEETKKQKSYRIITGVLVGIAAIYMGVTSFQRMMKIDELEYEILKQKIEVKEAYKERDRALELENLLRKGKAELQAKLEKCENSK